MAEDRFLIAPFQSGLQNNIKPFLIPEDAFSRLNNAYVWRGRVRKRFGSRLMQGTTAPTLGFEQLQSRLRIQIGTTDANGDISVNVKTVLVDPGFTMEVGQIFSIGDQIFTINVLGSGPSAVMLDTGTATVKTIDTTNGDLVINGADVAPALTAVFFYPALPVMGITNYEEAAVNDEKVMAFDTRFAYEFTTIGWDRLELETQVGDAVWTGDDSQFFWSSNWRGPNADETNLYVTNFKAEDRIRFWDGISSTWSKFNPTLNPTGRLLSARIVLPFKDRLICLNTIEHNEVIPAVEIGTTDANGDFALFAVTPASVLGQTFLIGTTVFTVIDDAASLEDMNVSSDSTTNKSTGKYDFGTQEVEITGNDENPLTKIYLIQNISTDADSFVNRCRFSQNGNPITGNAFIESAGKGGFIDAPTKEAIITAQFIKDRLIVYFERSTWELVYYGNQVLPFIWQKINTELGAESTFSQVPFDKVVLGVGNVGIHACNGANVERIDEKIPDEVYKIHNEDEGTNRVAGIRDYTLEMVYWTFPGIDRDSNFKFPNKVLTYNYKTGAWGFNDDSITVFGYFQELQGQTWATTTTLWAETNTKWGSGQLQAKFRSVVAGNQEGFVFIIDPDLSKNSPSIQITDLIIAGDAVAITAINHNLEEGQFVLIENAQGVTGINDIIVEVVPLDKDTFAASFSSPAGTYTGGGTARRVSQIDILTKQYNFYLNQARNASVSGVDFMVSKTASGKMTVDYFVSSSSLSLIDGGVATGMLVGTSELQTSPYEGISLEQQQDRLWHSIYSWAQGEAVQLRIHITDEQMIINNVSLSGFEMHAMIFHASPTQTIGVTGI